MARKISAWVVIACACAVLGCATDPYFVARDAYLLCLQENGSEDKCYAERRAFEIRERDHERQLRVIGIDKSVQVEVESK